MGELRVAFTGASGTGKTTLAHWVSETFNLPLNPIGSRSTASLMGFSNPYDVDVTAQQEYYDDTAEQLGIGSPAAVNRAKQAYSNDVLNMRGPFQRKLQYDKIMWELEHPEFCTDRSTFDDLVYARMHSEELKQDPEFADRSVSAFLRYTHVIVCPISGFFNLAGDPARVEDKEYHRRFEREILTLIETLHTNKPKIVTIPDPIRDIEYRKRWVRIHLS